MGSGAARWYRTRRGVTFWTISPPFLARRSGLFCLVTLLVYTTSRTGDRGGSGEEGGLGLVSCSVVTAYGGLRGTSLTVPPSLLLTVLCSGG